MDEQVKANLSATIQWPSGHTQPVEFVAFFSHTPFSLHVPAEAIAGGFYTELNRLQGYHNTCIREVVYAVRSYGVGFYQAVAAALDCKCF